MLINAPAVDWSGQMLGFILFTKAEEIRKATQRMRACSEVTDEEHHVDLIEVAEPYPVLQCLLSVHAPLVLRLIKNALEDWDCMEKDLLEAFSGGAVEEMTSVRTVTQVWQMASAVPTSLCIPVGHCGYVDRSHGALSTRSLELVGVSLPVYGIWSSCRQSINSVGVTGASIFPIKRHVREHFLAYVCHVHFRSCTGREMEKYVETEEEIQFCGIVRSVGLECDSSKRCARSLSKQI